MTDEGGPEEQGSDEGGPGEPGSERPDSDREAVCPEGVGHDEDDELPSTHARVTIETTDDNTKVDIAGSERWIARLMQLFGFVIVAGGAIVAPLLTCNAAPESFPVWATAAICIGQVAVLVMVAIYLKIVLPPHRK